MEIKTAFWTLGMGVPRQKIDEAKVKKAYRRLAKKTHPDKGGNATAFRTITKAYKFIMILCPSCVGRGFTKKVYKSVLGKLMEIEICQRCKGTGKK